MSLLRYRLYLANVLIAFSSKPSNITFNAEPKLEDDNPFKRRKVINPLEKEERLDGLNHFPEFLAAKNASKCRNEGCSSRTRVMCTKCKLYLCVNGNNCFKSYHTKQFSIKYLNLIKKILTELNKQYIYIKNLLKIFSFFLTETPVVHICVP